MQEYYHVATVLPANPASHVPPLSYNEVNSLRKRFANPSREIEQGDEQSFTNGGSVEQPGMMLLLDELMMLYQDHLEAQLDLFPHLEQKRAVFEAMLKMTKGDLSRDNDTGRTLLHWFAMNDLSDLIPKLVQVGFGVNDKDSDLRTPLHLAVKCNNYWSVESLLKACGADPHIKDLKRRLPWHHALAIDNKNVVENDARIASKANIIALLARYTNPDEVEGKYSRALLEKLRENPDAEISLTISSSTG